MSLILNRKQQLKRKLFEIGPFNARNKLQNTIFNKSVKSLSRHSMLLKTLPLLKNLKLYNSQLLSQIPKVTSNDCLLFSSINRLSHTSSLMPSLTTNSLTKGISFGFSSSAAPNSFGEPKMQNMVEEVACLNELQQELRNILLSTTAVSKDRAQQSVDQRVQIELEKQLRHLNKGQESEEQKINLKTQEKVRIQNCLIENMQFIDQIETNQNYRAMIMIRLEILWNEKYENLSIEELTQLIYKLESSPQLKNNDLKSIALIFLAVETLKKCLNLSRLHRNVVCSSKSLFENFFAVKKSLAGELEARSKLEKVEGLLNFLIAASEKSWNRLCFMKVQSQINFLTEEIFKSFHQPHLYADKSQCLTSDPPRALFDEPFHQEYDRFIEMSMLVLFDKKLKKQAKMTKMDDIIHIFGQLKVYEQGKLKQALQNENSYPKHIKKLRKNVEKMNERIKLMEWVKSYISKRVSK